jgi:hypothetical protein
VGTTDRDNTGDDDTAVEGAWAVVVGGIKDREEGKAGMEDGGGFKRHAVAIFTKARGDRR